MQRAAGAATGQDGTPTFRSTSELVLLDVLVLQKKTNTSTAALRREDLQVLEDGTPQTISFLSRDELPLSIVMLFDMTDTSRAVLQRLAKGAQSALTHLKPVDEVAVMVYAAHGRVIAAFATDREQTAAAIRRPAGENEPGGAFFNEAVWEAADLLQKSGSPPGRRVVMWLTNNLPNGATARTVHTESDAFRRLHESGALAAPILALEAPARHSHPRGDANKYAELTGGEAIHLGGKKVEERLSQLIDDLRSRYTIGYRPAQEKPAGTFCKVQVSLAPGGALRPKEWKVLARAGYYRH
ncbi:MAG: VWA domain-containing protein [Acidobacteriia bacterium]|nr:VWA domain-containing protein [Terriglobia bacterium]